MTATNPANRAAPGVIEFESLAWAEEARDIDSRVGTLGGARWAVVRYAPGARRDVWCTEGHRGFVLSGHISYELDGGGRLDVPQGSGFWLPPGSGHRGINGDEETQLFLIDVPVG